MDAHIDAHPRRSLFDFPSTEHGWRRFDFMIYLVHWCALRLVQRPSECIVVCDYWAWRCWSMRSDISAIIERTTVPHGRIEIHQSVIGDYTVECDTLVHIDRDGSLRVEKRTEARQFEAALKTELDAHLIPDLGAIVANYLLAPCDAPLAICV